MAKRQPTARLAEVPHEISGLKERLDLAFRESDFENQSQLAKAADTTQATVSRYFTGDRQAGAMALVSFVRLAKALDVRILWLLNDGGPMRDGEAPEEPPHFDES